MLNEIIESEPVEILARSNLDPTIAMRDHLLDQASNRAHLDLDHGLARLADVVRPLGCLAYGLRSFFHDRRASCLLSNRHPLSMNRGLAGHPVENPTLDRIPRESPAASYPDCRNLAGARRSYRVA